MRNINEVLSKGFTLIEILIVVVVLGVMAGLAIPVYRNNVEQSKDDEAKVNLYAIYTAEKIYKANYGTYWGAAGNLTIDTINQALHINLAVPKYYPVFKITANATTFIAKASQH